MNETFRGSRTPRARWKDTRLELRSGNLNILELWAERDVIATGWSSRRGEVK